MRLSYLLAVILLPALGRADHPDKKEPAKAMLFSEKGRHHFPISTKNKETQAFFDQGMTFYYGFNHAEAVASFRHAAELDPATPMPWWGVGLALGPNYNREIDPVDAARNKAAYEAAQKALEMSKHASPREKALIQALTKRYSLDAKADGRKLEEDYRLAMKKVAHDFPDDLDAGTLYVEAIMNLMPWKLWDGAGKAAPDTEEVVALLERILRRDPDHIGACHYQIHALEASPFPERALPSADRLLRLVSWQGHLTHMPGHIYIHTGDFDRAALSNELAIAADEAFFKSKPGKGVYSMMYYPHNMHFLSFARACEGRYKEALAAARKLADYVEPELDHMPMMEGFAVFPLMIELRSHKWDAVVATPPVKPEAKRPATRLFQHYAAAYAYAMKGQPERAQTHRKMFLTLMEKVPADMPMGTNTAGQLLPVAAKTLAARMETDPKKAVPLWREVVALEGKLNYGEPPDWIFRGREHLGAALLRAGMAKEAEAVFREELTKLRRSGRALLGLARSLEDQRRDEEARLVEREFERAWPREAPLRLEDY